MEYELLDTGVFDDQPLFRRLCRVRQGRCRRHPNANHGDQPRGRIAADLHLLPTLWFRNDWSQWIAESNRAARKPRLEQIAAPAGATAVAAVHPSLGEFVLYADGDVPLLFTENETNHARLFQGENESPYVKDGINDYVVDGNRGAVNPGSTAPKSPRTGASTSAPVRPASFASGSPGRRRSNRASRSANRLMTSLRSDVAKPTSFIGGDTAVSE